MEKDGVVEGLWWGCKKEKGGGMGGPLGRVFIRALEKGVAGGKFV